MILETQFDADQMVLLAASEMAPEIIVWIYNRSWISKLSGQMIYPTYRDMIAGKPDFVHQLTKNFMGFFSGDEYRAVINELANVVKQQIADSAEKSLLTNTKIKHTDKGIPLVTEKTVEDWQKTQK